MMVKGESTGWLDAASGHLADLLGYLTERFSAGRVKWLLSLMPPIFFVSWEYVWHYRAHRLIDHQPFAFLAIVLGVALLGSAFVLLQLHLLDRAQALLRRQNRDLATRTVALEALYELGTRLSALHDVASIKETAVRRARQLLGTDMAGLALLDEARKTVRWELVAADHPERTRFLETDLGQCIGGDVIQSGEPLIVEDADPERDGINATRHLLATEKLRAVLVVPVRVAGKPIGALMAGHRAPYSFQLYDLKLFLGLANQVAVAINNAHLYERMAAFSALEERERLAREMHDGLAQLLGHVTARAAAAREVMRQGRQAEAAEHLDRLREVAQDAYLEVRHSIMGLRTRPGEPGGFVEALRAYLDRTGEQERMRVRLELPPGGVDLSGVPENVEVQGLRIVQEALNNARRHSRADEVCIAVALEDGGVSVTVRDEGTGFDLPRVREEGGHFGLESMRERAESVGGRFQVETRPGQGTAVEVWLPAGPGTD